MDVLRIMMYYYYVYYYVEHVYGQLKLLRAGTQDRDTITMLYNYVDDLYLYMYVCV